MFSIHRNYHEHDQKKYKECFNQESWNFHHHQLEPCFKSNLGIRSFLMFSHWLSSFFQFVTHNIAGLLESAWWLSQGDLMILGQGGDELLAVFSIIRPTLSCSHSSEFLYTEWCHDIILLVPAIGQRLDVIFINFLNFQNGRWLNFLPSANCCKTMTVDTNRLQLVFLMFQQCLQENRFWTEESNDLESINIECIFRNRKCLCQNPVWEISCKLNWPQSLMDNENRNRIFAVPSFV